MSGKKTAYHHGDLPRTLKAAALELIAEHGVTGFTLREAARRAGVTHAAPYRHFPDKTALLAAMAEDGFALLKEQMEEAAKEAGSDPLARFLAQGPAYLRFAVEQAPYFRLMFGFDAPDKTQYESLARSDNEAFRVLVDAVAAAQSSGQLVKGDPERVALVAWLMVHGIAHAYIDGALARRGIDSNNLETEIAEGSRLFLHGFLNADR